MLIATTDLNLIAGLIAVGSVTELDGHRKLLTIGQNARCLKFKAVGNTSAVLLQKFFKRSLTVRSDHIHDRHAFQFIDGLMSEHFKVG